jgi:hypothetical protein
MKVTSKALLKAWQAPTWPPQVHVASAYLHAVLGLAEPCAARNCPTQPVEVQAIAIDTPLAMWCQQVLLYLDYCGTHVRHDSDAFSAARIVVYPLENQAKQTWRLVSRQGLLRDVPAHA